MPGVSCHGGDSEVGHKADAGQRLAAEPKRGDAVQILTRVWGFGFGVSEFKVLMCWV